ncbi:nickel ABC transporter substrate-binding protein [Bacillus sp. 03113]|uniref:nickel ABC transporter substrate-binding protein n=1 Tax=Bacillus sp. 03113 TaxID=2578211 RepID=UPI0011437B94|nr:nickel ABC transporter substrate-binding protein [Bacillus sp. 03113]
MIKTKWKFYLMLVCCAFVILSGCTSKKETTSQKTTEKSIKDELVYASTKDIRDINPHLYAGEMAAQNMVFEPLVKNTEDGIKPALAEKWDISPDGLVYTFHLRKGVTFSDGAPFNAEAVKLNFDALLGNIKRHSWINLILEIADTKVVDENTFQLVLKHPYYPTLTELGLTRPFRMISPNSFIDGTTANGVQSYAGTGPYKLTEHKKDQYALFTANENYWGDKPKIQSVKWKVMPDAQTILIAMEKGEIDLLFGSDGDVIDNDSFQALKDKGTYKTIMSDPIASRAILLNAHAQFTNDKKVREAFQYAINKDAVANGILNGTEKTADTLMAKNLPYANVGLKGIKYNPDKAKKILTEDGWELSKDGYRYKDGKKLEVTIYYNSDNAQERTISESMLNDLKEIGVSLKIAGEEKQAFLDRQKTGEFDMMYSLSWGLPYDPHTFVSSWRIPATGDYQTQVGLEKKEWLDNTITDLMIEQSEEKRKAMYKDILSYIHEEGVYIPLTYSVTKVLYTKDLKGVGFNVSQYEIPFEKMSFE